MAGRESLCGFSLNGARLLPPGSPLLHSHGHGEWFSSSTLAFEHTSHSSLPCRGRRQTLGPSFLMRSLRFLFSFSSASRWLWQGPAWREGRWPGHSGFHRRLCSLRIAPCTNERTCWFPAEFSYFSIGSDLGQGVVLWLVVGLRSLKTSTRRMIHRLHPRTHGIV